MAGPKVKSIVLCNSQGVANDAVLTSYDVALSL